MSFNTKSKLFISLFIVFTINLTFARTYNDNKLKSSLRNKNINESTFYDLIDFFENLYREEVIQHGAKKWEIRGDWKNGDINAFAMQYSGNWTITIYGGLARHHAMTTDGLAFTICHEIGHHLGGAPKDHHPLFVSWNSVEGQADYYASSKCFWKYLDNINITFADQAKYPPSNYVKRKCRWAARRDIERKDYDKCLRSMMAGYAVQNLHRITSGGKIISFHTPDRNKTNRTIESHPNPQCRLDTIFAGVLCPVKAEINFDEINPNLGACHQDYYNKFARPACWYKNWEIK